LNTPPSYSTFPLILHTISSAWSLPQGMPRSVISLASVPRPITSQVWAPSISSQTRTQRVQSTQRLWSMPKRSWWRPPPPGREQGQLEVGEPNRPFYRCNGEGLLESGQRRFWSGQTSFLDGSRGSGTILLCRTFGGCIAVFAVGRTKTASQGLLRCRRPLSRPSSVSCLLDPLQRHGVAAAGADGRQRAVRWPASGREGLNRTFRNQPVTNL